MDYIRVGKYALLMRNTVCAAIGSIPSLSVFCVFEKHALQDALMYTLLDVTKQLYKDQIKKI